MDIVKRNCGFCNEDKILEHFTRRSTEDGVISNDFSICNQCVGAQTKKKKTR